MRVIDYFDRGVSFHPERKAVVQDGRSLTYRELDQWTRAIAAAIYAKGPWDGVRIAVYSPNDIAAFACILAAFRVGAVWRSRLYRQSTLIRSPSSTSSPVQCIPCSARERT